MLLHELNDVSAWRAVYGKPSRRLKDEELILRFFALYFSEEKYESPMKTFLNKFSRKNRRITSSTAELFSARFTTTIDIVQKALGSRAFRLTRAFNAAVYDAVMVGLSRRLDAGPIADIDTIRNAYAELIEQRAFVNAVSTATAREDNVSLRLDLATAAFASLA